MDWYRNAQTLMAPKNVLFATDLIESEGHVRMVQKTDCMVDLFNIDRFLPARQSHFGNIWRNFIKIITVPMQVWKTRRIADAHPDRANVIFHAHAMYYMWVCWLAGVKYVGTPQGSEILVRPRRSSLYRAFAIRALRAAAHITVDSESMRQGIERLCGRRAHIVQNGIDIAGIQKIPRTSPTRERVVSIRIIGSNYQIHRILEGREQVESPTPLTFVYPQWEDGYRDLCRRQFREDDQDLGRLARADLYRLLLETLLVVSIPASDSSPRSVYEGIFCGCCVAVTPNDYIMDLPACMRGRLCIVDLNDPNWLKDAIKHAREVTKSPYHPSEDALDRFDQMRSLKRVASLCYGVPDS